MTTDDRRGARAPAARARKTRLDPANATREQVLQKAVDLLKRRAHTERELRRKLRQRGYPALQIDAVLEECLARSWLSDTDVAAAFADELVRSGRYGPRRIRQKLQERGVAPDDAEAALELAAADVDWVERARTLIEKRTGLEDAGDEIGDEIDADERGIDAGERGIDAGERGRLTRFLVGRGFTHADISAALRSRKE